MQWRVKVEMVAVFEQRAEVEFTVEAATEEEAKAAARDEASVHFSHDRWEAEYDHTYTDGVQVECCELGVGAPIRCKMTPDMFRDYAAALSAVR